MKRNLIISLGISLALLATSAPMIATAHQGEQHDHPKKSKNTADTLRERVENRRNELRQRFEQKRSSNDNEQISGDRKTSCDNRETSINTYIDSRAASADRFLQSFINVQTNAQTFASNHSLNVTNGDELVAVMDNKRVAAQAAIDVAKSTDFECDLAPEEQTGQPTIAMFAEQKKALREYRDAIKAYVAAVRQAAKETN